jgi:hypothetical protein
MSKTRIKRRASDTRSARRSLVELTAAASRAVDDGLFVTSANLIAAPPDDSLQSEQAANTSDRAVGARRATTSVPVALPESLDAAVSRSDELIGTDSTAEMFVKIAKDYQNRTFESVKVNLNAALDHAKDFVEPRHGSASPDNFLTTLNRAAAQFGAALELLNANVITTLEYARDLSSTTTAAQFVELSSAQARKQYELILKQASALRSLAETITKSNAE